MKLKYNLVIIFVFVCTSIFAQFGDSNHFVATKSNCPFITEDRLAGYFKQYTLWCDQRNTICDTTSPDTKNSVYAKRLNKVVETLTSKVKDIEIDVKAYISYEIGVFSSPGGNIRISTGLMDFLTDDELLVVITYKVGNMLDKQSEDAFKKCLIEDILRNSLAKGEEIGKDLSEEQLLELNNTFRNFKYSKRHYYATDCYVYEQLAKMKKDPSLLERILWEKSMQNKLFCSFKSERKHKLDKLYKKAKD